MTIYVAHASGYDFKKELYEPLKSSKLAGSHEFIIPHDTTDENFDSKELFASGNCDLVLADVSFPSTGMGIELGWADDSGVPIFAIAKKGSIVSSTVTQLLDVAEYEDTASMVALLSEAIAD